MPEKIGFQERVLEIVKRIPRGRVTTYGAIAKILHTSSRAVGQALKRNPKLIEIPCHRVVKSNWELGGYVKGAKMKKKLLENEDIDVNKLKSYFWTP